MTQAADRRITDIIKNDDSADIKHPINKKEINQRVVECMPAINQSELERVPAASSRGNTTCDRSS